MLHKSFVFYSGTRMPGILPSIYLYWSQSLVVVLTNVIEIAYSVTEYFVLAQVIDTEKLAARNSLESGREGKRAISSKTCLAVVPCTSVLLGSTPWIGKGPG